MPISISRIGVSNCSALILNIKTATKPHTMIHCQNRDKLIIRTESEMTLNIRIKDIFKHFSPIVSSFCTLATRSIMNTRSLLKRNQLFFSARCSPPILIRHVCFAWITAGRLSSNKKNRPQSFTTFLALIEHRFTTLCAK